MLLFNKFSLVYLLLWLIGAVGSATFLPEEGGEEEEDVVWAILQPLDGASWIDTFPGKIDTSGTKKVREHGVIEFYVGDVAGQNFSLYASNSISSSAGTTWSKDFEKNPGDNVWPTPGTPAGTIHPWRFIL